MFQKGKTTLDKKTPFHSSYLTVMIVRGMGTIRSFKLSSRVLFWSFLFFVLYIIASVIVINDYFSELRKNSAQSVRLEQLMEEVEKIERDFYQSKQHLAFLKDYIHKLESGNDKDLEPPEIKEVKPKEADPDLDTGSKEMTENPQNPEIVQDESQENKVDIKDFTVQQEGADLKVDFKLVNANSSKNAVSGYVHIIAVNNETDSQQFWSSPNVALQDGVPVNYKQGQLFVIKYYKTIRGRYAFASTGISPSSIKVLVYSRSGDLVLERVFETTKEAVSKLNILKPPQLYHDSQAYAKSSRSSHGETFLTCTKISSPG